MRKLRPGKIKQFSRGLQQLSSRAEGLPWWLSGKDSALPTQGSWIQSLVQKLRCCMVQSKRKKQKVSSQLYCCYHHALNLCFLLRFCNDVIMSCTGPAPSGIDFNHKVTLKKKQKNRTEIPAWWAQSQSPCTNHLAEMRLQRRAGAPEWKNIYIYTHMFFFFWELVTVVVWGN